jgi:hypothetical protein
LEESCEYDLESDDEEFLAEQGLSQIISEDTFEKSIDLLEKLTEKIVNTSTLLFEQFLLQL